MKFSAKSHFFQPFHAVSNVHYRLEIARRAALTFGALRAGSRATGHRMAFFAPQLTFSIFLPSEQK